MLQVLSALILFSSVNVIAQESPGYTLCKNNSIVRSIRVEKDESTNDFVTLYTKSGKDKEVGRAKWRASAESFQTNIKANLEKAGWDCRSIANYKVTNSKE